MKRYVAILIVLCLIVPAVLAEPPKCILKADPLSGTAPLTVKVSEESRDETIVDWWYDFGDEHYLYHEAKGEHVYDKAGEFTITLHVVNDKGEEATDKATITVSAGAEPTPTPTPTATPTPIPTMNETTTVKVVYEGNTTIKDALATKSTVLEKESVLKTESNKIFTALAYPYKITDTDLDKRGIALEITKYEFNDEKKATAFTIKITKEGKSTEKVALITPGCYWDMSNAYKHISSTSLDTAKNEMTYVIKEDPVGAVETVLKGYV